MRLDELHERFKKHLYLPDPTIIDFTTAVVVANAMSGDPVWGFIVAPPSSGKTEVLASLKRVRGVHPMSSLTASTFLSGKNKREDGPEPSLLLRLGSRATLVLKDFGTILSMREETRAEILAQLREIYDGSLTKEFGTGASLTWTGKIGFIAGTTPAIDHHHSVLATLGERFVYFRVPEADRRDQSSRAARNRRPQEMRDDLQAAMTEYLLNLRVPEERGLPDDVLNQLVGLSDIGTWARSAVYRDRFTRDIEVAPSREAPARFVRQLASLWRALDAMAHPEALRVVTRVALDSIPPARSTVLKLLGSTGARSTSEVRLKTHLSSTANKRLLEDLEALELVEIVTRAEPGSHAAHTWDLTPEGRKVWFEAFPNDPSRNVLITPNIGGEGSKRDMSIPMGVLGDGSHAQENGLGIAALLEQS